MSRERERQRQLDVLARMRDPDHVVTTTAVMESIGSHVDLGDEPGTLVVDCWACASDGEGAMRIEDGERPRVWCTRGCGPARLAEALANIATANQVTWHGQAQLNYLEDWRLRAFFSPPAVALLDRDPWPDPRPLPTGLPPVCALVEDLIPAILRPWLADIAHRMQCPLDFPAVGALVGLATVVGRGVGVHPKRHDDWTVIPNLWGAIVAPPGMLKTPALEQALSPVRRLEARARERHELDTRDHEFSARVRDARKREIEKRLAKATDDQLVQLRSEYQTLDTTAPVARRYIVPDATPERLGVLLAENPRGVLVFRDELTGWFGALERDGHESERAFLLECWAGTGSYTYDRIGRGTIHIPACCVSLLGGIQPGPLVEHLREAVRGGRGADGLVQRLQLAVWPDVTSWRHVDQWPDTAARTAVRDLFERLDVMDPAAIGAQQGPHDTVPWLPLAPAGQEIADAWYGEHERRLRVGDEHAAVAAHLAKYRSLMPSLALLGHLADGATGPVSGAAVERAAAWCTYLESHARRMYASVLDGAAASAELILGRLRVGKLTSPFGARQIIRACWTGLGTSQEVTDALEVLAEHGWVRAETAPAGSRGGRPTLVWRAHPSIGVVTP